MKNLLMILLLALSPLSAVAGGDLGGGGLALIKELELSPREKEILRSAKTPQEANQLWLQMMDDRKNLEILNKVFRHAIAPQIK